MKTFIEFAVIALMVFGLFAGAIGIMFMQDGQNLYAALAYSVGINFLLGFKLLIKTK
jgi:hypothetical protein